MTLRVTCVLTRDGDRLRIKGLVDRDVVGWVINVDDELMGLVNAMDSVRCWRAITGLGVDIALKSCWHPIAVRRAPVENVYLATKIYLLLSIISYRSVQCATYLDALNEVMTLVFL